MTKIDSASYASFIGVNKAVIPGIRILNDFLVSYFGYAIGGSLKLSNLKDIFNEEKLKEIDDIVCKELDENKKRILFKSLFKWIKSYIYYSYGADSNNNKFLIPITKNLLYKDDDAKNRSRGILFRLLYGEDDNKSKQETDKQAIENFLFDINNNSNNSIYGNIISIIDSIIIKISEDSSEKQEHSFLPLDGTVHINSTFLNNYRKDFDCFLKSECFNKMDIYRKISNFSLFLNFYETLYLVNKAFEDSIPIILVKGFPGFTTDSGKFHHAALGCFSDIREKIFRMSENFFEIKLGQHIGSKVRFKLDNKCNLIIDQDGKEQQFKNSDISKMESLGTKESADVEKHFIEYLQIDIKGRNVERKEIARAIVELHKKMSSSVRVVSSMLSGQGKEARMVYPTNNVRQKYFAMSGEITELLLMLFLTQEHSVSEYATLSGFLRWLERQYGIYIAFSDKLIDYLNENSIQVPSTQEFNDNVQAFINTLESINSIYKLSDTSYIVCMPGKLGGIPQI